MTNPDRRPTDTAPGLEAGTAAYRRVNLAMFIGGFATFALLYTPQPLLPELASVFAVSPATASLAVSAGTGAMAMLLIPASILSDRHGRVKLMKWSLAIAALIALASAAVDDFLQMVVLRALLGAALAGLPAAAMAYLGDEVAPHAQGRVMGLYIAGNALGGMSGRVFGGLLADVGSWRIAMITLGVLGVIAAIAFWRMLPESRRFQPRTITPRAVLADIRTIYANPRLVALFTCGFLLMGAFFGVYNYLGFRLQAPPFSLPQSLLGAIFLLYLMGSASSAWAGRLSDRYGGNNVVWAMMLIAGLGLATTLSNSLPLLIAGVAVFTFGYFGAHSTAIGWVGQLARERRALASALYLSSYYLGSSLVGSLTGIAWDRSGWPGLTLAVGSCLGLALIIALWLRSSATHERTTG
ncbi:MAG TPA: MFS transporter [Azoarcus taiwanensis]|nr:MFS transporter [Azoarcus taiwanensis]